MVTRLREDASGTLQDRVQMICIVSKCALADRVHFLEVGDQVVVVVSMRSGQRCIKRCEAANTAASTSTILAK